MRFWSESGEAGTGRPGRPAGTGRPERPAGTQGWGILDPAGFTALTTIGIVDNSTRGGFLVLLPFLLIERGASVEIVGLGLTLVFAGGALGKLVCGLIAERIGIVRTVVLTELTTAGGILLISQAPPGLEYLLLPLLGIALNGTSSVLYGTVGELVRPERRARAFALFYTITMGAGGLAPILYGALADQTTIPTALWTMSAALVLILPVCRRLRV